ncbi:hypothetical protein CLMAG_52050 [Clostridium magnum DSM 2767]|uniref:Uncharacterized protein n=1 Tax=Clostridium magnum DSM 2767 TaxID=1121326 RepID=A0A161WDC7_9CLOT|nr:hypothetical protein CLMAG_52050 [Clostridium magnum DSM 2767]
MKNTAMMFQKDLKNLLQVQAETLKDFCMIAYDKKKVTSNILKLKVPKSKPKTLSKDEIEMLVRACSNLRDKFLLSLLYETGNENRRNLVIGGSKILI